MKTIVVIFIIVCAGFLFSYVAVPNHVQYGVSFSKFHSDELGLPWRDVLTSILNDLGVRHFRLSAHWPMVEPEQGKFDWSVLDEEMNMTRAKNAGVILAVGRRLPGWPECHTPPWHDDLLKKSKTDSDAALLNYITETVNRYKNYSNLEMWQVENEPFLSVFANYQCGKPDPIFLDKEIALVHSLDPVHPVLVTDSGELGTWYKAYSRGDIFGTSIYLYVWSHMFGQMRYPIGPWFFHFKQNLINLIYGAVGKSKPSIAIEVSAEPWLLAPIKNTAVEVQLSQMDISRFKEMITFTKQAGFATQYLWGAEWWYYMKLAGHAEFWDFAKTVFRE